mmetsp:Transcript_1889/g.6785  ORF Transcript_1889/g.6785 Transcript_1889/m.6785 type:complete len:584 (-) Transcript_1889:92-1843(-)
MSFTTNSFSSSSPSSSSSCCRFSRRLLRRLRDDDDDDFVHRRRRHQSRIVRMGKETTKSPPPPPTREQPKKKKTKKIKKIREVDFSGNARNDEFVPAFFSSEEEEEEMRKVFNEAETTTTPATTTTRKVKMAKRQPSLNNDDENIDNSSSSSSSSSFTSQFRAQFKRIFLPDGFPNTVSRDYLPWLKWQMLSLFFRDVLEVLSAQSLLVAVGMDVNQANAAAPVAGAAKWVLKDGTGGLATLALGALNTKKFDENPKFFWSTANSLEDVSRAMELLTPLFPSHFLLIAGTATFVRSAALTGRSSLINGTFMTHFSRNENAGDIRTKLEVQGRWLQIAALPVGIALFRAVTNGLELDFATNSLGQEMKGVTVGVATYGSMLFAHSFCCYMAAKSLNFETLSRKRALIQAKTFVESNGKNVLSVEEVSDVEGVWLSKEEKYLKACKLGVAPDVVSGNDWEAFERVRENVFANENFVANVVRDLTRTTKEDNNNTDDDIIVACMLTNDAGVRDVLSASLVVSKLMMTMKQQQQNNVMSLLKDALLFAKANVETFELQLKETGFRVDVIQTGDAPRFEIVENDDDIL